jgi:hypothetical protein
MEKFFNKRAVLGGFIFLCFLLLVLMPMQSQARKASQRVTPPLAKTAQTEHSTRYIRHGLDVNDFRVPMTNYAIFGQFIDLGAAGGEWPRGTNEFYIYGAGIWVGGTINDPTLQTFNYADTGSATARDRVLYGVITDPRVVIGYNPSGAAEEFSGLTDIFISDHPEDYDTPDFWPLLDDVGNPIIVGIEDSYCEYDDQDIGRWDTGINSNAGDGVDIARYGLGVKVIQRTHSWNYENNKTIHFFIYQIVNVREDKAPIRNCHISIMCDADVGPNANDDKVGFDASRNLGYAFDSDGAEQGFARIPGYLAYKFLESPAATYDVDLNGDDQISDDEIVWNDVPVKDVKKDSSLGLTSFKTSNLQSGDPLTEPEKFIIMAGHEYPDVGDQRYAPFDLGTGDTPQDQRFFQSTGPFLLAAPGDTLVDTVWAWDEGSQSLQIADIVTVVGDTVRVVVAVMMAPDEETLPQVADIAQSIYDIGFILPRPPEHPEVTLIPDDQKVLISWDSTTAELSEDPYFEFTNNPLHTLYDPLYKQVDFEGYRLYRSTSGLPGTFELLGSWDMSSATPRHVDIEQLSGPTFEGTVSYDEDRTENEILVDAADGVDLFSGNEFLVQVKFDGSFFVTNLTLGVTILAADTVDHYINVGEPPFVFEVFDSDLNSQSTVEKIADGTHDDYFDDCYLLVGGMLVHFKGDDAGYVPTEDIIFNITGYTEQAEGDETELGYAYIDSGLINGVTYYYDVTAFDFQPFSSPRSLENGIQRNPVTPRSHATGIIEGSAHDVQHISGTSDGSVEVIVVEPDSVSGHEYEVGFYEGDLPLLWYLKDLNTGQKILDNMSNQTGNDDYPLLNRLGMVVKVMGPAELGFNASRTELNSEGLSWNFNQAYMSARNVLNNANFRNFLITFVAGPGDTTAEGLYEDDEGNNPWGIFLADPTLASVPFEFWDLGPTVDDPSDDVRLWPLMYDFYGDGFHTDDYLVIVDKNNAGNTYAEDFFSNPDHDPASDYWGFDPDDPASRYDWDYRLAFDETDPVWAKGDEVLLVSWKPNWNDDVFTFKTSMLGISKDLINLDDIKVVPNPYIVRNLWERSRDYSVLAFTHLPDKCTIRIYTLSGDHLITLEHDSPEFDGNENWDLLTKNEQKIAAGVYIYHVDSEYGEKIGKFAVVR